jgi:hypothetical protein
LQLVPVLNAIIRDSFCTGWSSKKVPRSKSVLVFSVITMAATVKDRSRRGLCREEIPDPQKRSKMPIFPHRARTASPILIPVLFQLFITSSSSCAGLQHQLITQASASSSSNDALIVDVDRLKTTITAGYVYHHHDFLSQRNKFPSYSTKSGCFQKAFMRWKLLVDLLRGDHIQAHELLASISNT